MTYRRPVFLSSSPSPAFTLLADLAGQDTAAVILTFADVAIASRGGTGLSANPYRADEALRLECRRGWLTAESRQIQTGIFGALRMMEDQLRKGLKRYGDA